LTFVWEELDNWISENDLEVYDLDTKMKGVLVMNNTSKCP